jgi:putative AlgH/UPF0301 family transcriptional regulator
VQIGRWFLQGIYTGGLAHANELVQTGRAVAQDFRLLAGYMHWHESALHAEVARGEWWLVAASREYLLSLVRGGSNPISGKNIVARLDCFA